MPQRIIAGAQVVTHHFTSWAYLTLSGVSTAAGGVFASAGLSHESSLVSIGAFVATVSLSIGTLIAGCMKAYWEGKEKSIARDYNLLKSNFECKIMEHKADVLRMSADHELEVKDLREQVRELIREIKVPVASRVQSTKEVIG